MAPTIRGVALGLNVYVMSLVIGEIVYKTLRILSDIYVLYFLLFLSLLLFSVPCIGKQIANFLKSEALLCLSD